MPQSGGNFCVEACELLVVAAEEDAPAIVPAIRAKANAAVRSFLMVMQ
jgi:hypothetical protein